MKKILVLAPHTDDGEFGCGGTISKLVREGNDVFYVAFSSCEKSLPKGADPKTLIYELMNATKVMGIKSENVIIHDFPVRDFPKYRQEILEIMIKLSREINPDLVFVPSIDDIHQDHHTVSSEALRAFKRTSILGYELPWNNFIFKNQVFYCLDEIDIKVKIEATACYKSQNGRDYSDPEYLKGVCRAHGVRIGVKYAEVFETNRMIFK